ncbi:hypothetical protein VC83_04208 [Pseudogymnoascus destructans]|uniref:Actin binding protein n=2 Tax=Pseudogymnoascus destructans TaxID=655981 RepID=L8G4S3_PSED2|nr:uncharacterized protein VC83_04208 [Pseudogymnoascus destructans]ELR06981.1 hypothetical protein GMDG_08215 [Pseudogymnoascus destructans 20631-21]OAF59209.1 hypothetical protein VC83_04208 [Pseudogymnoascus destructans]
MASLNTSTNGPSIRSSYQGVVQAPPPTGAAANSPTYAQWAIFSVSAPLVSAFQQDSGSKESVLKVQDTGEGELQDLIEDFSEGRIQFAFVKLKDSNSALPKSVLIGWCGEGVPERTKGYFTSHLAAVSKILHGYHVQVTARSDRDLTPEGIIQKVADASGSKYSAGSASAAPDAAPAPAVASKPVFTPTQSGAGSSYNPLGGAASRKTGRDSNVDEDGWGADAPQVSRSQIEKVPSAYQPTKVNMAELTKEKQDPSRFNNAPQQADADSGDVVKGGYQPIGKVDIAAIRAKAKKVEDDRPTTVKGAYEPVGKVDIAAIRAKAQKPTDEPSRHTPPAPVKPSATTEESDEAKSLADRSSAFQQSERLTSLPKPKVANKLPSNFAGTKAPTPGTFGLHSAVTNAAAAPAPVGVASRTFADEGGKTPAQIWAEKKAKERGTSGATETHTPAEPVTSQSSGGGEWKSGYKGKSWAPVAIATTTTGKSATNDLDQQRTGEQEHDHARDEEEAPWAPAGGIGALKDRFKGAAPMGVPANEERDASPPPVPSAARPTGGVSMPGLPCRPAAAEEDEDDRGRLPSPPRVARSPTPPTPERDESPVRIAMPVSRGSEPHIEAPEERHHAPSMPVRSLEKEVPRESELPDEPKGQDPARAASAALAGAAFGGAAVTAGQSAQQGGKRAIAQYDYEKAEDNEIELLEGEYVTEIDMVDDDWWMGTNSKGESGLFPSNYVELVEDDEPAPAAPSRPSAPKETKAPAAPAAPAAPEPTSSGPTATAIYDYEAAEDNELSFKEDAKITDLEFPDEDWWFGHLNGKSGLFPSNYVQLDEK